MATSLCMKYVYMYQKQTEDCEKSDSIHQHRKHKHHRSKMTTGMLPLPQQLPLN